MRLDLPGAGLRHESVLDHEELTASPPGHHDPLRLFNQRAFRELVEREELDRQDLGLFGPAVGARDPHRADHFFQIIYAIFGSHGAVPCLIPIIYGFWTQLKFNFLPLVEGVFADPDDFMPSLVVPQVAIPVFHQEADMGLVLPQE
jgi:hypothetical protein